MPRQARIVEPGFPHHVMHRGNNRRRLFSYPRDYRKLLRYLLDAVERVGFAVNVHALAVMTNHLHLIVTPKDKRALSAFVKSFAQRYADHRNRERGGSGKLFEARYKSKPMLDDAYLAICHAYLELNPVRAGLVDRPTEYPWASYAHWTASGDGEPLLGELLTPSPFHLGLGATPHQRSREYARWVYACHIFGAKPTNVTEWDEVEAYSRSYTKRLERPDGSSAREPRSEKFATWARTRKPSRGWKGESVP